MAYKKSVRKRSSGKTNRNFKILQKLILFLVILFIFAGILKLITVVVHSAYDPSSYFTFSVLSPNNNTEEVIGVSAKSGTASVLTINGNVNNVQQLLEIPVEGHIVFNGNLSNESVQNQLRTFVFHYAALHTDLTFLDLVRLWYSMLSIDQSTILQKSISLPQSTDVIDAISSSFLKDPQIFNESKDVQIINASGISGLGNRLARMIANTGANVVSVKTADSVQTKSVIEYKRSLSYTVSRFQKTLSYKAEQVKPQIVYDIIIIIGTDTTVTAF